MASIAYILSTCALFEIMENGISSEIYYKFKMLSASGDFVPLDPWQRAFKFNSIQNDDLEIAVDRKNCHMTQGRFTNVDDKNKEFRRLILKMSHFDCP